jgi:hypothetical protein
MAFFSKHPFWVALLMALLLAGCGGSSSDPGNNGADNPPVTNPPPVSNEPITDGVDLSSTELEANQGQVFDLLKVTGLPDGSRAEDFHGEFKIAGEGQVGPGIEDSGITPALEIDNDGEVYLLVPLVNPEGATINLRVTDGTSFSRTMELEIAPLPEPVPGALEAFLDASETLIQKTAEAYGLSYPDDLQAFIDNPQSLQPEYVALVHGYHVLGNPNNPEGLRQVTFDDQERRDLERLIGHMNLLWEVEQLIEVVTDGPNLISQARPYFDLPSQKISPESGAAGAGTEKSSMLLSPPQFSQPRIYQGIVAIDGPEDLVAYMREYNIVRETQEHIEAGVQMTGRAVTVIGIGAAFVVSGPGGGAATGAAGTLATAKAVGTVVTVVGVVNGASTVVRGLFPCCIHAVDMELLPESGIVTHEDEDDPSLFLAGMTATVRSEGVDLTKEVLERAINIVGKGQVSRRLQTRFADNAFSEELIDAGTGELFNQLDLTGTEIVFEWHNVDIAGDTPEDWLDIDLEGFAATAPIFEKSPYHVDGNGMVAYRLNADRFFGNEDATDILGVRPSFDKFPLPRGHGPMPSDSKTLGANVIEVRFDPAGIRLDEPGEVVPFTVTVLNARDTEIEELTLDPEVGTINGPFNSGDDGVYEFEYEAPDELPNHSIYVSTYATSLEGVRGRATPTERRGSMRITTDAVLLDVTPPATCLDTGDTYTFEALDPLLGTPVDVTWSVDIGSITSNGTYTAASPRAPGYATVTATSTQNSDVTGTARVTLGCDCWWSGSVGGGFGQQHSHDTTSIFQNDDLAVTEIMFVGRGDVIGTRLVLETPIPAGATGTYEARTHSNIGNFTTSVMGFWGNSDWYFSTSVAPLQVHVDRHDMMDPGLEVPEGSRIMEVRVNGTVIREEVDVEAGGWRITSGQLSLTANGSYWFPPPMANMLNCSIMGW